MDFYNTLENWIMGKNVFIQLCKAEIGNRHYMKSTDVSPKVNTP